MSGGHEGLGVCCFACWHLCECLLKVAMAQQLVERGSDPDRVNVLSKTAFELAMQLKQRELKAYLDTITTVRPQTGETGPVQIQISRAASLLFLFHHTCLFSVSGLS